MKEHCRTQNISDNADYLEEIKGNDSNHIHEELLPLNLWHEIMRRPVHAYALVNPCRASVAFCGRELAQRFRFVALHDALRGGRCGRKSAAVIVTSMSSPTR